jgi:hypothetical protein
VKRHLILIGKRLGVERSLCDEDLRMPGKDDAASTTAAAKAGDTEAGIRTRAVPANSISIAATCGMATSSPADATST